MNVTKIFSSDVRFLTLNAPNSISVGALLRSSQHSADSLAGLGGKGDGKWRGEWER